MSMATVNCLATNIFQNTLFHIQQKKKNKIRVSKCWQNIHFWVTYPLKSCSKQINSSNHLVLKDLHETHGHWQGLCDFSPFSFLWKHRWPGQQRLDYQNQWSIFHSPLTRKFLQSDHGKAPHSPLPVSLYSLNRLFCSGWEIRRRESY